MSYHQQYPPQHGYQPPSFVHHQPTGPSPGPGWQQTGPGPGWQQTGPGPGWQQTGPSYPHIGGGPTGPGPSTGPGPGHYAPYQPAVAAPARSAPSTIADLHAPKSGSSSSSDHYTPLKDKESEDSSGEKSGKKKCVSDETKKKLNMCSLIVGVAMGLASLVTSIVAYSSLSGFVQDFTGIVNSWETSPIVDITVVPAISGCPAGYEALTATWPGIYDACECPLNVNSTSSRSSSCSSKQREDSCQTFLSVYPNPVTVDLFVGSRICFKRQGPTALTRPDAEACPSDHRLCGNAAKSTCYPKSQPCPIVDIGVLDRDLTEQESGADGKLEIPIAGTLQKLYLYFSRQADGLNPNWFAVERRSPGSQPVTGLPLVSLVFQPNDPCTLNGCGFSNAATVYSQQVAAYQNAHPRVGYQLKPMPCTGGCSTPYEDSVSVTGRDIRYIELVSVPEDQLFNQYPADIPVEFRTGSSALIWFMSARSEIPWAVDCPQTRANVQSKSSTVEGVRSVQMLMLVISILSFIILSIYFPFVECVRPDIAKERKKLNCGLKVAFKLASLICTIITIVFALRSLSFFDSINGLKDGVKTVSCSDPLSDESFTVLGAKFQTLSKQNYLNSASASFTMAVDGIAHFVR